MAEYSVSEIKELSGLNHIRKHPGMYVGDLTNTNQLLIEVMTNSVDEARCGFCNLILVSIDTQKFIYTVADNGRGIPTRNKMIVKLCTDMFTGAKFTHQSNSTYPNLRGTRDGIGLKAVNALSEFLEVIVYKDKKIMYKFKDGVVEKETTDNYKDKPPCSTCVRYKPDRKYFESCGVDVPVIKSYVKGYVNEVDNLKIILCIDNTKIIATRDNLSF